MKNIKFILGLGAIMLLIGCSSSNLSLKTSYKDNNIQGLDTAGYHENSAPQSFSKTYGDNSEDSQRKLEDNINNYSQDSKSINAELKIK